MVEAWMTAEDLPARIAAIVASHRRKFIRKLPKYPTTLINLDSGFS
jgi:hypothetical protein